MANLKQTFRAVFFYFRHYIYIYIYILKYDNRSKDRTISAISSDADEKANSYQRHV